MNAAIVALVTHEPTDCEHDRRALDGVAGLIRPTVEVWRCGDTPGDQGESASSDGASCGARRRGGGAGAPAQARRSVVRPGGQASTWRMCIFCSFHVRHRPGENITWIPSSRSGLMIT